MKTRARTIRRSGRIQRTICIRDNAAKHDENTRGRYQKRKETKLKNVLILMQYVTACTALMILAVIAAVLCVCVMGILVRVVYHLLIYEEGRNITLSRFVSIPSLVLIDY